MKNLTDSQRYELRDRLCAVANKIGELHYALDKCLSDGAEPLAIMNYAQLEWSIYDPIAYSAEANAILQRIVAEVTRLRAEE